MASEYVRSVDYVLMIADVVFAYILKPTVDEPIGRYQHCLLQKRTCKGAE